MRAREAEAAAARGERAESAEEARARLGARTAEERRAAAATFTEPAAIFDALKAGDVLMLSARWLMARAGYEEGEVEVEAKYPTRKVKVKKWVQVREAAPLPCRQQIEADHPEAILPAAELERIYGKLKWRDFIGNEIAYDALPVVSVSQCAQSARANARSSRRARSAPTACVRCRCSCWQELGHPDAEARTLRTVAAALAGEWGEDPFGEMMTDKMVPTSGLPLYAAWGFADVGIFFGAAAAARDRRATPRRPPTARGPTRALVCRLRARACRQIMRACIRTSPCRAHPFRTSASRARCATVRAGQSRGGVGSG